MKLLRALLAWIALRLAAALGREEDPDGIDRAPDEPGTDGRIVERTEGDPRAEVAVAAALVVAALLGAAFVVAYALDAATQILGLALGGACVAIGVALTVMSKRVLPTEQLEDEYPLPRPEDAGAVAEIAREGVDGVTRKKLLIGAGGAAGCALGAAAIAPALSLGPALDRTELHTSPWRRGVRLIDVHNVLLRADDIEEGAFYTAFAEGAPKDRIASPVVLVRVPEADLALPPDRAGWAPQGILAYSKICTHAGCAVSLYRHPLYAPTEPKPALVCPCHYSTFDPAAGAKVLFGPAGRPLPQLPLTIAGDGTLVAGGPFSGDVGPAWSGMRRGA